VFEISAEIFSQGSSNVNSVTQAH